MGSRPVRNTRLNDVKGLFFFSGLGDHASDPKAADAEAFPGTVRLDSADFCGAGGLVLLHGAPDEPVVPNLWCQGHSRQQT